MSEKFTVEIISPDKTVTKNEAEEVTIPCYEGDMGILKNHISFITFLRPGVINIKEGSNEKFFFVEDGTVEFSNNNLLILSSTVIEKEQLNRNFIDKSINEAEEKFNKEDISDKEKYLLSFKIETLRNFNR